MIFSLPNLYDPYPIPNEPIGVGTERKGEGRVLVLTPPIFFLKVSPDIHVGIENWGMNFFLIVHPHSKLFRT